MTMTKSPPHQPMTIGRLLEIWAAMAVMMIVNGALRELVLKRVMDASTADIASAVLGATIVLVATRFFFRPLAGHPAAGLALTPFIWGRWAPGARNAR